MVESVVPGQWSEWTECSASCGGGIRTRKTVCNSGEECVKQSTEEPCNTYLCARGDY